MTAQFSDGFSYKGKEFSIAGINGEGLFNPVPHGFIPKSTCTACWKGFVAGYAVNAGHLVLDTLDINLEDFPRRGLFSRRPPRLNGRYPSSVDDGVGTFFDYHFEDVGLQLPFSGGILIGDGFIQELYVHMGYHPAWKYEEVYELLFDNGRLSTENNVSEKMKEFRLRMKDAADTQNPGDHDFENTVYEWVKKCFSLDYNL
ncbi:MAG: hypothetical protein KKA81_04295 [Bacteroidetes bacterium]|nr:hypothetical protein [Bacteroidota bacterium]